MPTRGEFIKDAADIAFTGCSVLNAAQAQPGGRRRQVAVKGRRVQTVDVHAHCVIPETVALMGRKLEDFRGPGIAIVAQDRIREMD